MPFVLRLLEDNLQALDAITPTTAPPRAIFITAGSLRIGDKELASGDGIVSLGSPTITAGPEGACIWRWEISPNDTAPETFGSQTCLKMQSAIFDTDISATHLLRLDSVAFPPGGCAYLHTHQGPGIRCLIEGRIRIDTEGHSASYGPGSPWFEAGPEPVFAQADEQLATRFIRTMVLPKNLAGKSSISYVNKDDQAKPKSQSYRVFGEQLLG